LRSACSFCRCNEITFNQCIFRVGDRSFLMTHSSQNTKQIWGAVLAMSICAFALVASEFLPVSLLTPIARELVLTEGQAGQAISVSGFFAVLTSITISRATRNIDRKSLLLILNALMIASGVIVSTAPNYALLTLGRAVLGVSIGGCWAMNTAVIIRIAPQAFVPRAIALVQGGSALATAVAAPVGSFLGSLIGWRNAFSCIVPLAVLALLWQGLALPNLPPTRDNGMSGSTLRLLGNRRVLCGVTAVALLFTGQFALFTYLRPFLETVTNVDATTLSILLLLVGVAGFVSTMVVGRALEPHLNLILIATPFVMSILALALILFGQSVATTAVLLTAWGLVATAAPVAWFTWLSKTLPNDAEAGGGLMVAAIQLAITLGAMVGGILLDRDGFRASFGLSIGLLVLASVVAYITAGLSGTGAHPKSSRSANASHLQ
jgi:predicted MFS family arabinose efflux permease